MAEDLVPIYYGSSIYAAPQFIAFRRLDDAKEAAGLRNIATQFGFDLSTHGIYYVVPTAPLESIKFEFTLT